MKNWILLKALKITSRYVSFADLEDKIRHGRVEHSLGKLSPTETRALIILELERLRRYNNAYK